MGNEQQNSGGGHKLWGGGCYLELEALNNDRSSKSIEFC